MKKIAIGIVIILFVYFCFNFYKDYSATWKSNDSTKTSKKGIIAAPDVKILDSASYEPIDLYNESITTKPPRQVELNEIELAEETLAQLQKNNWNGSNKSCKFDYSKVSDAKINIWEEREEQKIKRFSIEPSLVDLYTSPAEQKEIQQLSYQMRREYFAYLKEKSVAEKYLTELEYVIPEDSKHYLFYFNKDPDMNTFTEGFVLENKKKDYRRSLIHYSIIDFHNNARLLRESGIIGDPQSEPYKDLEKEKVLRNMAMRMTVYHELTHSLTKAYTNLQVDPKFAADMYPFKNIEETTMELSKHLFWKWGYENVSPPLSYNYNVAGESQADGMAFNAVMHRYNLSEKQQKATWDHLFGRLTNVRDRLLKIKNLVETKYPEFYPQHLDSYIENCLGENNDAREKKRLIQKIAPKTGKFEPYTGYFNPMTQAEVEKLIELMKE